MPTGTGRVSIVDGPQWGRDDVMSSKVLVILAMFMGTCAVLAGTLAVVTLGEAPLWLTLASTIGCALVLAMTNDTAKMAVRARQRERAKIVQ